VPVIATHAKGAIYAAVNANLMAMPSALVDPDFRAACQSPPQAGAVPVRWFLYVALQEPRGHTLANSAKAIATRKLHLRMLRLLQDRMAELFLHDCPLPAAIEFALMKEAIVFSWHPSTLARYLAAVQGAFTDLPLYSEEIWSINLSSDPHYRAALKAADAAARQAPASREIVGMSKDDIVRILELEPSPTVRSFIILTWVTAGRLGDVAQLCARDVRFPPPTTPHSAALPISITFRKGKTVPRRGPYTVDSQVTQAWATEVKAFLAGTQPSDPLFTSATASAGGVVAQGTAAFRRANPVFESRGLRRGALQTLARSGIPLDLLMLYSGHKQVSTLYRYLNWGQVSSGTAAAAAGHATALLPGTPQ
jgi:integrase